MATEPVEAILRWVDHEPVLVFELDLADPDHGVTRRPHLRLVASIRGIQPPGVAHPDMSAVLLLRARTPARLLSCVRAVTRGAGLPPDVLLPALRADTGDEGLQNVLTHREFDVLHLLADGSTTRDIASHLSYSERTVKNIVRSVLDKLGCRTRAHAVAIAARQGVL